MIKKKADADDTRLPRLLALHIIKDNATRIYIDTIQVRVTTTDVNIMTAAVGVLHTALTAQNTNRCPNLQKKPRSQS